MAARKFAIPSDAADALRTDARYDGPRVTIARQLTPGEWRGVKTVLEKLGAVYVPNASAFEFEPDQDARTLIMRALADGWVMGQSALAGFVATPDDLAVDLVNEHAEIYPVSGRPLRVLEPSAGQGAFVRAVLGDRDECPEWLSVTAVEMDTRRARYIPRWAALSVDTFEAFHARATANGHRFDRVVMNPPFSTPGHPDLWAEHLLLAWDLLAPGGRLVAVVPGSATEDRAGKRHRTVRELIRWHGYVSPLERDAFAASGTMMRTAVVVLDRITVDGDPDQVLTGEPAWIARPHTGDPVPVDRPLFTRAAARVMPVQAWYDGWRRRTRTLRYVADCAVGECGRPTWAFDDGENDPRGVLGETAAYTLDADEHGRTGPPVGLCFGCGNDADAYGSALDLAVTYWRPLASDSANTPAENPAPVPDAAARAGASDAPVQEFLSGWALADV